MMTIVGPLDPANHPHARLQMLHSRFSSAQRRGHGSARHAGAAAD